MDLALVCTCGIQGIDCNGMQESSSITDSESDLQTLRFAKKSGLYKDGVFHHLIRADHMHFHANASLTDWH